MQQQTCFFFFPTTPPRQVGDIIVINKTWFEVQKILLQHTRLKDSNGAVLWYPNIKMVGEQVQNLTRSDLLWQSLKVLVVRYINPTLLQQSYIVAGILVCAVYVRWPTRCMLPPLCFAHYGVCVGRGSLLLLLPPDFVKGCGH